ncbi:hypothetical protein [Fretibacter rubidus]|uniref:hypothetical protein n=1 Tax=Fretibacter rubidus TaxID=570162 RepID=UPI00352AB0F9
MKNCFVITLMSAVSLTACATSAPVISTPDSPKLERQELAPQTLAIGECGLFVWTADDARRFILFSKSQDFTALWQDGTAQRALAIDSQDGTPTQGQFPLQTYANGMTLRLQKAQSIDGGARYRGGTLSMKDEQGWENITPVIGVSTCR